MNYFCNPLNLPYKYQLFPKGDRASANREAADPSMVLFNGRYYLFVSMTGGFYVSDDLLNWALHKLPENLPAYDYAPDVRVIGDYLYFCASKRGPFCPFFRTKDPLSGEFEEIEGTFTFWDPNMFVDSDSRVYFYWGCSNATPIYGVELDPKTMTQIGEVRELIFGDIEAKGFERLDDDHTARKTQAQIEADALAMAKNFMGVTSLDQLSEERRKMALNYSSANPYVEGAWMDKIGDTYYLQYAIPGTQYNTYGDGVYVSKNPLGPFTLAKSNPFSYKPGGFINGAGHGSSMADKNGDWWHISSMRISISHNFERRLGLWKAGFDSDGDMYCDQRFGDWPMKIDAKAWDKPEWMLLSYGKAVEVSSGVGAENVTGEDVRKWWKSDSPQSWVKVDLGCERDVRAIQVNFADDEIETDLPAGAELSGQAGARVFDDRKFVTRWILEGSIDDEIWFAIEDKSQTETDLPHDFIIREDGVKCRFVKLTVVELPYNQNVCVSGLRVFGFAEGDAPAKTSGVTAKPDGDLDMLVSWKPDSAAHNILWGYAPEKLYHSYMVFDKDAQNIGALIKGEPVYVRVDAFNECGITEGDVFKVK